MPEAAASARRYAWLAPALQAAGGVVLTASRRLARTLRTHYDTRMLAEGRDAWPTPAVHFWQDWLARLLVEHAPPGPGQVLPAAGSVVLWERCLKRELDTGVLSIHGLARQANAAWQRLQEWRVPHDAVIRLAHGPDERAFAAAYDEFRRTLRRGGWLDIAELPGAGIDAIAAGSLPVPADVWFAGFDRPSPLIGELIRVLQGAGASTHTLPQPAVRSRPSLASFVDEEAELRAAGRFARGRAFEQPEAAIGIVVSELEQDADRVARLVREGYAPGWQSAPARWEAAVELSYGRRLADYPSIAAALLCLRWAAGGLRSAELSTLIRTPYLQTPDTSAAANLDRRLRRMPDRDWSTGDFLLAFDTPATRAGGAEFLGRVRELHEVHRRAEAPATTGVWAAGLGALLERLGWPGPGSLDSEEFQLVNRWRELLNEFARLGAVLGPVGLSGAVQRISALCAETIFQPERGGARLQVVGPLEAAGMEFDALWVARCDADRWPPAAQPSPLLSRALQIEYGMPDASPSDTLAYSRTVLGRLAASAAEVTFSWPRTDHDAVRLPSPLLSALGAEPTDDLADPGSYAACIADQAEVSPVPADPVPPVAGTETVAGGANVVNLQRREPFSAFAVGRLGIRELDAFRPGITAGMRGNLIHDALRRLYAGAPTRAELAALSPDDRASRIDDAVGGAVAELRRAADPVLRRVLDLEGLRICDLLGDVLDADLEREPFRIVGVETRLDYGHAGVKLTLQADRIDELSDGSRLIIDYKTGQVRPLQDRDGDPVDAQLFVYAAALQQPVGGLALMQVRRQGIAYRALGASIEWSPMDADDWQACLQRSERLILAALESLARGDVRVNVRDDRERRWQLDVLCRAAEVKRGA